LPVERIARNEIISKHNYHKNDSNQGVVALILTQIILNPYMEITAQEAKAALLCSVLGPLILM
jgi:hypothetical protein